MSNFMQPIQSKNPFLDGLLTFGSTSQASSSTDQASSGKNIDLVCRKAVKKVFELQEPREFNLFPFDRFSQQDDAIRTSLDGATVEKVVRQRFGDSQREHGFVESGPMYNFLNGLTENPDRLEHSHVESNQLLSTMDCEPTFQQSSTASEPVRLSDSSKIADPNSMGSLSHAPIPRGQITRTQLKSSVQPGRKNTRIACEHCYKAKQKCDDSRPCERCRATGKTECVDRDKKRGAGKTDNEPKTKRIKRVCTNCHKAKSACSDKKRPCHRCIRVNKENSCIDRPLSAREIKEITRGKAPHGVDSETTATQTPPGLPQSQMASISKLYSEFSKIGVGIHQVTNHYLTVQQIGQGTNSTITKQRYIEILKQLNQSQIEILQQLNQSEVEQLRHLHQSQVEQVNQSQDQLGIPVLPDSLETSYSSYDCSSSSKSQNYEMNPFLQTF